MTETDDDGTAAPDELERIARQAEAAAGSAPAEQGADVAPAAGGDLAEAGVTPSEANRRAIGFLLAGAREVLCLVLKVKSLQATLDDRNVEACANVLAPVADKYGVRLGGFLDGPEGPALMVAGPILWAAWRELDRELGERRRQARDASQAGGAAGDGWDKARAAGEGAAGSSSSYGGDDATRPAP